MHDINYIMLIKQNEQISSTLQALGRQRHSRRCEIKPTKSQRSATSGKFLTVQWSRACWDMPSKVKDKFPNLASATINKEAKHLAGFFRF